MALVVEALSYAYGTDNLFKHLSFSIKCGEILHIRGGNGCGKTTLLRLLAGLLEPEEGSIYWQGQSVTSHFTKYQKVMGYIGHKLAVHPKLSVKENVQLSTLGQVQTNKVLIALQNVELTFLVDDMAEELSAGQLKRIALAKLFCLKKALWLLDEPFSALDNTGQTLLKKWLVAFVQQQGMVVITSHLPLALEGVSVKEVDLM